MKTEMPKTKIDRRHLAPPAVIPHRPDWLEMSDIAWSEALRWSNLVALEPRLGELAEELRTTPVPDGEDIVWLWEHFDVDVRLDALVGPHRTDEGAPILMTEGAAAVVRTACIGFVFGLTPEGKRFFRDR